MSRDRTIEADQRVTTPMQVSHIPEPAKYRHADYETGKDTAFPVYVRHL